MNKEAVESKSRESVLTRHVVATQLIRPLKGRSLSVLAIADDSRLYVVKFVHNPAGSNNLANELLGERLCRALGVPTAEGTFVYVPQALLDPWNSVWAETLPLSFRPSPGVHYGACYVGNADGSSTLFDILPRSLYRSVLNRADFLGMLILDIWANHQNHRQAVFQLEGSSRLIKATFIDHGDMFGGSRNSFDDTRSKALYLNPVIYSGLLEEGVVEQWKHKLSENAPTVLGQVLDLPKSWYDDHHASVCRKLMSRLKELDSLLEPFISLLRTAVSTLQDTPRGSGIEEDAEE